MSTDRWYEERSGVVAVKTESVSQDKWRKMICWWALPWWQHWFNNILNRIKFDYNLWGQAQKINKMHLPVKFHISHENILTTILKCSWCWWTQCWKVTIQFVWWLLEKIRMRTQHTLESDRLAQQRMWRYKETNSHWKVICPGPLNWMISKTGQQQNVKRWL